MSDDEVVDLIFAPGFSTAAQVTDLSGRGVGMDVVRTAVERLGGRVTVSSRPGAARSCGFTLPFTVMMTQVLTVEAAGQVFGVPMEAVVETVRVERATPSRRSAPRGPWCCATAPFPSSTSAQALGRETARVGGRRERADRRRSAASWAASRSIGWASGWTSC